MPHIIQLTDLSLPQLDVFARLTEAQLRNRLEPDKGIFIAESPKVIGRALEAGCRPLALLMERRHLSGQGLPLLARCGDIPVYTGDGALLASLTGYRLTRGILCAMARPAPRSVEQVCSGAHRLAVLEGITDSTNVGALFRSAAALGMDGVLLSATCCDPLNRRAVRVSMGAVFQLPWARMEPGADGSGRARPELLEQLGFCTLAMALHPDAHSVDEPALAAQPKLAILLGTEGEGLSPDTIAACRHVVRIPMSHGVDSLNVAAASAVAFWELRRR
jgi:tRNA G18 (ribose-2'-O)-methylase SpoU